MSDHITVICAQYDRDRSRLMDILLDVQESLGCVSPESSERIAEEVGCAAVEVDSVVSFYAFLSHSSDGHIPIRLCNDVVDLQAGAQEVAAAFEHELGIPMGGVTEDGLVGLQLSAWLGLSDQAPAALIGHEPLTKIQASDVPALVATLRDSKNPAALVTSLGEGNNGSPLVQSMVDNNVVKAGPLILAPWEYGEAIRIAAHARPALILDQVKDSGLKGRGGAAFPTGVKWAFAASSPNPNRTVICNADEGEPGTFKDRVILTEYAGLMIEGMVVAARAIEAHEGIIYLRAEYAYLRELLESEIANYRADGLLGWDISGVKGFDFDIRIQMGAGAYICGEETSLIASCEGLRGDPRNKPPFPAREGFMGRPTVVNNVETFCAVSRILSDGVAWYRTLGTESCPGTKVLSVSGDCDRPGIYEVEFGTSLREVLVMARALDTQAVLVGGPSGAFVAPTDFDRKISFDDLATGGAIVVFDRSRDLLSVVQGYLKFFCEESCGYCTPCRFGNEVLLQKMGEVRAGFVQAEDVDFLKDLGKTMKAASRCGLGQNSPNPVLSTIDQFPELFTPTRPAGEGFDLNAAVEDAARLAGRKPTAQPQESGHV